MLFGVGSKKPMAMKCFYQFFSKQLPTVTTTTETAIKKVVPAATEDQTLKTPRGHGGRPGSHADVIGRNCPSKQNSLWAFSSFHFILGFQQLPLGGRMIS
ncbi:hypothetical protein ACH5RR_010346 [Cinchona calisaya]|uniref:Uncharacterized protein n=1 Tax=Cinchona calisaya TaxID=153742 RepID=A0ABD3AIQ3_9GENT